ncbi:hypothetical protein [Winogradskyella tangerina]|nr:hypothetical protein [Winogradskyella tangerina]
MKYNFKVIAMIILALITIYGLITGRYLFLFIMFPLGLGILSRKDSDES